MDLGPEVVIVKKGEHGAFVVGREFLFALPAYPVDSLRAPGFVQRMGVAPSIMDYARFNYVAQPEDKGAGLYPRIGPYDDWSIIYGYKYLPGIPATD